VGHYNVMFGRVPTDRASMLGVCIEGLFYGIYSAIFVMYLRYQTSKKDGTNNILFYLICILYVLSIVTIVGDMVDFIFTYLDSRPPANSLILHLAFLQITVTGFCDFLAQVILIYRCWVVWGRNIRIVIIPSFLSIAFLGIWLTNNSSWYFSSAGIATPTRWGGVMLLTSLTLSLVVNALATGLIVLRIFMVYQKVKPISTEKTLDTRKLRSIMFILIESGIALFSMQLVRLVLYLLSSQDAPMEGYALTLGIDQMLHGIIPTIILVRVSMGLSFHDDESMVEATTSFRFAVSDHSKSNTGTLASVTVAHDSEESSIQQCKDIGSDDYNNTIQV